MSANIKPLVATLYNPQTLSKDALVASFVVRQQKFERIFDDIHQAPMTKPEQHYLIQGLRGMGKTTLLLRIAYEIENTPDLYARLLPVVFNEEEYGITSLSDIWERTAQYVEEADPAFAGLYDALTAQYGQPDYEARALQTLLDALRQHGRKLLLLIDNMGDLLKKLDRQEEQRLREVLLTVPDLRLIGATSVAIEQAHDYGRAFYDFFKIVHLNGLNRQEAIDLFLKLGETYHTESIRQIVEQQPGRIEAIRRLTGGVIRTMVLLFEILVENNVGSVFRDLNVLLDRVTPLYKHRMDDLPAQQQKIVAALANAWDAANARELAQVVRLESKVVSAQLKQLINNGVVERVETNTKNHLYRLEERFFNIWYLMRFGRRTDQRVLWLVRFFEEMFVGNEEWMMERIDGHLGAMKLGTLDPEAALLLTTALSKVIKDEQVEHNLIRKTKEYLLNLNSRNMASEITESKIDEIDRYLNGFNYFKALENLEQFKNKSYKEYLDMAACNIFTINDKNLKENLIIYYSLRENMKVNIRKMAESDNFPKNYAVVVVREIIMLSSKSSSIEEIKINSGFFDTAAQVILEYFLLKEKNRKKFSLNAFKFLSLAENDYLEYYPNLMILKYIVNLWNNFYELDINFDISPFSLSVIQKAISDDDNRFKFETLGLLYLKLLLAKKQYHTAYKYFQQEEWQLEDQYKPLYYATLHFLRDEYPTEYLRMGPELKETVDDILAEVAQMAIDYA